MLLSEGDRKRVHEMLGRMVNPVRLVFFTQSLSCDTCVPARQILDELVTLGDKLSVEEHNFVLDREAAAALGIDRVPAIAIASGNGGGGIRFFGLPAGYEFSALIDAIVAASTGQSGLSDASRERLKAVASPVSVRVFVTPT